jgi:hypothetical protein
MTADRLTRVRTLLSRHSLPVALLGATLLALPTMNSRLLQDDVVHRVMLLDPAPTLHWSPFELYDFIGAPSRPARVMRDAGFLPWFASDSLRIRFFRPLSSLMIAADVQVFGTRLWAARSHSLVWFLAILVLTGTVHRRFLSPTVAGLATVVYSISFAHMMPVGWIAARHELISCAFSLGSFLLHVRGRERGSRAARVLSLVVFAAGLLASEMALGTLALIAAWELFAPHDSRRRVVVFWPWAALTVLYLAYYVGMGYGVRASGGYVSLTDGFGATGVVIRHFLILVADMVAAVPSDPFGTASAGVQWLGAGVGVALGAAAVTLFFVCRRHIDRRDVIAVRWLTLAAAAAAVPGSFALLGGRVLTLALVPASGIIAALIGGGVEAVRSGDLDGKRRFFAIPVVAALAFGQLVGAPILRVLGGVKVRALAAEQHALAAATPPCPGVMVIVAAADPTVATYVPVSMALLSRRPERLRVLSMAPADHRIENVTATGFDLVVLDRGDKTVWEALYGMSGLRPRTHVTMPSLDALVLEGHGGLPGRVRFDFHEPLRSGRLCFYAWGDGRLEALAPPRPGEVRHVPYHRGPMGW